MSIVVIANQKGGVGKTKTATGLAAVAAQTDVDVVLLDTDAQGSSLSWSRIRDEAGVEPSIPTLALSGQPAAALQSLSAKYDLVVVDVGANSWNEAIQCAMLADMVLIPCGPDRQEVESTFSTYETISKRVNLDTCRVAVVLTRVEARNDSRATAELRQAFDDAGIPVFATEIAARSAWRHSGVTGKSVNELPLKTGEKATAELVDLYNEIVGLLTAGAEA